MDRTKFQHLADACIERIASWLEDFDPDEVDFCGTDGVIALEFADGKKFVLNRQAGSNQMWYASGARAWHYDWDGESATWRDDRDGHELFANVSRTVSEKLGREVRIEG
jgi:CyaY protein